MSRLKSGTLNKDTVEAIERMISECEDWKADIDIDTFKQKLFIFITERDQFLLGEIRKKNNQYWADRILSERDKDKEYFAHEMLKDSVRIERKTI